MKDDVELILINPWIYDFAAYDLWSKPLGLLYLGACLRKNGFHTSLIDCLDIHHPARKGDGTIQRPVRRRFGTGKFLKERVPTPAPLRGISRPYSRYGFSKEIFIHTLEGVKRPHAILLTSLMTYWYPGVQEAIRLCKQIHPRIPVLLGGTYARLCRDHARRHSGADLVVDNGPPANPASLWEAFENLGIPSPRKPFRHNGSFYPAFDLLNRMDYICIATSFGCPYRCPYCASHYITPHFIRRTPSEVIKEILYWQKEFGIKDFALYDDAFLVQAPSHAVPILEKISGLDLDIRFHTPNALHIREIGPNIADLLRKAGFKTIRLGLESSDRTLQRKMGRKVKAGEFEKAVAHLTRAGFTKQEIGVYVLMGLPGQSVDSVMETIDLVDTVGATPYLAEYSPIPHTTLWDEAVRHSEYDLQSEPLFHNNSLLSCWSEEKRSRVPILKQRAKEIRHRTTGVDHLSLAIDQ